MKSLSHYTKKDRVCELFTGDLAPARTTINEVALPVCQCAKRFWQTLAYLTESRFTSPSICYSSNLCCHWKYTLRHFLQILGHGMRSCHIELDGVRYSTSKDILNTSYSYHYPDYSSVFRSDKLRVCLRVSYGGLNPRLFQDGATLVANFFITFYILYRLVVGLSVGRFHDC